MKRLLPLLALPLALAACGGPPPDYRQAMLRYHEGRFDEAIRLLRPLANAGHAPSRFQLAMLYAQIPEHRNEALAWLQQAAQAGHVGARYQLALVWRDGAGLPASRAQAEHLFAGLAREGYAPAQFELARLLEAQGAPHQAEAVQWYARAAEAGHQDALQRLASAHERGELGLPVNARQGAQWRQRMTAKSF